MSDPFSEPIVDAVPETHLFCEAEDGTPAEIFVKEPLADPGSSPTMLEIAAALEAGNSDQGHNLGLAGASTVILLDLQRSMERLQDDFERKLKYDAQKKEQIDKLYDENRSFRDGIIEDFKKQLLLGVIEQIDEAEKKIAFFSAREGSEADYRKLLAEFSEIAAGFREMLMAVFEISSHKSDPGTLFDPKEQRALKTRPCSDQAKNKTIAASIRFGYKNAEGEVIRREMVDVYTYAPDAPPENQ